MREIQTIIEALAESLGRAVAVDDPKIHLIAHTAHDEKVDEHRVNSIMTLRAGKDISDYVFGLGIRKSETPVRVPHNDAYDFLGRWCFPIRCQRTLLGYLWLIDDDESLTESEVEEASRTAVAVGEALFRQQLLDDLRTARERELFIDLVSDEQSVRKQVSEDALAVADLRAQMPCRVAVFATAADDGGQATLHHLTLDAVLRRAVRKLPRAKCLIMTRSGRGYLLAAFTSVGDKTAEFVELAQSARAELAVSGADDVLVGIGSLERLDNAHRSFRRAETAASVARVVPGFGEVTRWDDLGIYQLLSQLPLEQVADVAIPPGLQALLEAQSDEWLVDTLDTFLDAGGNVQESAKLLHIHRATLYYRLSRIEALTGMSLADGRSRLALHVGIKVSRLLHVGSPESSDTAAVDQIEGRTATS